MPVVYAQPLLQAKNTQQKPGIGINLKRDCISQIQRHYSA
jgi:hypothetical protein